MPPTLSVIIPAYNQEATIGVCLVALHASKFRDFEVIVVDDKSTDDTAFVARAFACKLFQCAVNCGPAAARNLGASLSCGKILFFLDADILVQPDSLGRIVEALDCQPEIDALFGSFYPDSVAVNFFSRYKNLVHHHTHQVSREEAATFCGGFGAVRRDSFFAANGFDPKCRFLEDVEMGVRLHRAGGKIRLYKSLCFSHCKRYSFSGLIRCDLFHRAIPWTRLILKTGAIRNDLNTRISNVLSVPVSYLLLAGLPALLFAKFVWVWSCLLAILLALNWSFLSFAWRERGGWFAIRAAVICWIIYLSSGLGVALGILGHIGDHLRSSVATPETVP